MVGKMTAGNVRLRKQVSEVARGGGGETSSVINDLEKTSLAGTMCLSWCIGNFFLLLLCLCSAFQAYACLCHSLHFTARAYFCHWA